jgi:hypothetical protein
MNVIELIVFLLVSAGLGFLGHLVSPRYGWGAGAVLAVPMLIALLVGSFREALKDSRKRRSERGRTDGANLR